MVCNIGALAIARGLKCFVVIVGLFVGVQGIVGPLWVLNEPT